jgi:hypothetical protein
MHVPEENLEEYRRRMALARKLNSIGNMLSGTGDYAAANKAWQLAGVARHHAQELRVPGKGEGDDAQA